MVYFSLRTVQRIQSTIWYGMYSHSYLWYIYGTKYSYQTVGTYFQIPYCIIMVRYHRYNTMVLQDVVLYLHHSTTILSTLYVGFRLWYFIRMVPQVHIILPYCTIGIVDIYFRDCMLGQVLYHTMYHTTIPYCTTILQYHI